MMVRCSLSGKRPHMLKLFFLLTFMSFVSVFSSNAQAGMRKINTWYIYNEGKSSFKDIEPYKDIISAISVFGNPPKVFIEECHKHGIEVYHAVSDKESAIDSPQKREEVSEKYLAICRTDDYDGIDLDYEGLNLKSRDIYTSFLKEVSAKLHVAGKKLSQCVGFYDSLYKKGDAGQIFYDVKVLTATCDYVRVMCYDMYFAPGRGQNEFLNRDDCQGLGATSCYPFAKAAMEFWLKHIPGNKLIMGLPAYSNDYDMTNGGIGKQVAAAIPDNVKGRLPHPAWLWFERINMYLYKDNDEHIHLFYASDETSTEALLKLAEEFKIDNIGFWHLSSVSPEMWNVTRAWIVRNK